MARAIVQEIVDKIKPIDDGGMTVIKTVMAEVLGECSESTWNSVMDEVLLEVGSKCPFWCEDNTCEFNGENKCNGNAEDEWECAYRDAYGRA